LTANKKPPPPLPRPDSEAEVESAAPREDFEIPAQPVVLNELIEDDDEDDPTVAPSDIGDGEPHPLPDRATHLTRQGPEAHEAEVERLEEERLAGKREAQKADPKFLRMFRLVRDGIDSLKTVNVLGNAVSYFYLLNLFKCNNLLHRV